MSHDAGSRAPTSSRRRGSPVARRRPRSATPERRARHGRRRDEPARTCSRPARGDIDLGAIAGNVRHLRAARPAPRSSRWSRPTRTGTAPCAARAALDGGADWLGVADLDEAIALRARRHRRADPRVAPRARRRFATGRARHRARDLELASSRRGGSAASAIGPWCAPEARHRAEPQRHRRGRLAGRLRRGRASSSATAGARPRPVQPPLQHLAGGGRRAVAPLRRRRRVAAAVGLGPQLRHLASTGTRPSTARGPARLVRIGIGLYGVALRRRHDRRRPRAPPGDDPARAGRRRRRVPAGHGRLVRLHLAPSAPRPSRWCRSATPTASRARRRAAAPSVRSAAALPVAGRIAMDQFIVDVGDARRGWATRSCCSATRRRRALRRRLGRCRRHDRLRDRHPDRAARAAHVHRWAACAAPTRRLMGQAWIPAGAWRRSARRSARMLRAGDLVVLTGPLGAGKTTLTRGIGEGLGVRGPVQSPTFVLARTHPTSSAARRSCTSTPTGSAAPPSSTTSTSTSTARSSSSSGARLLDGVDDSWLESSSPRGASDRARRRGGGPTARTRRRRAAHRDGLSAGRAAGARGGGTARRRRWRSRTPHGDDPARRRST